MSLRCAVASLVILFAGAPPALAGEQTPASTAGRYINPVQGASLHDLVERALSEAPALSAARAREAEARGALEQAGLRPNPTLSVQRREEADTAGHQTSVGLAWPLDLFRRDSRIAVADESVRLAGGVTDEARWRRATEVRAQAGRFLAAVRRLEIANEVASTARATFDLVAARAEAGAVPPLERDQAEVAWRRHEADALRLTGEVEAELARLKALVGLEQQASLTLRADLESTTRTLRAVGASPPSVDGGFDARPDIRLARIRVDRASAGAALERQAGRLDMALTAGYSRNRAGFPQLGLDAADRAVPIRGRTHSLTVGVTVALPWRNDNRGAVAAADAAVAAAEHLLGARQIDAGGDLEAARSRDAAASAALEAIGGAARELAARNLDVVRESHALGRAALTDVLDETRRYLEFELAYTAALADAFLTRVALDAALGVIR